MSADNGIYIAKFPKLDGSFDYRVAHCQAIENVDCDGEELQDHYRFLLFGGAPSFDNAEDAYLEAGKQYDEIMADDFCPVCEYGIQPLEAFTRPMLSGKSIEEAGKWLNQAWLNQAYNICNECGGRPCSCKKGK